MSVKFEKQKENRRKKMTGFHLVEWFEEEVEMELGIMKTDFSPGTISFRKKLHISYQKVFPLKHSNINFNERSNRFAFDLSLN